MQHAAQYPSSHISMFLSTPILPVQCLASGHFLWTSHLRAITNPDQQTPQKSHQNVENTQDRPFIPTVHTLSMVAINITNSHLGNQAVFAPDTVTAAGALALLILATRPTFKRIKARRFSSPSKSGTRDSPLKSTLGTYLFLWPALLCLFVAYVVRFVGDLLKTTGRIAYAAGLGWNGQSQYDVERFNLATSISALSFTTTLANIFFTVLLNGGVWIHSSHVQENGTGISTPKMKSKIWNMLIMLAMLGTGLGAWGRGMSVRDIGNGSLGPNALLSWSNVLQHDQITRILYIVHEAIVVAASLSVTAEVLQNTNQLRQMRAV